MLKSIKRLASKILKKLKINVEREESEHTEKNLFYTEATELTIRRAPAVALRAMAWHSMAGGGGEKQK